MAEKVFCKWDTCRASFGTHLSMGLHVLTEHLDILDYGEFVLQKSIQKEDGASAPKKAKITATRTVHRTRISVTNSEAATSSESQNPAKKRPRLLETSEDVQMAPVESESAGIVEEAMDVEKSSNLQGSSGRQYLGRAQSQDPQLAQHIEMIKTARNLSSRIRMLPPGHVFFETQYYCFPCLQNLKSPCLREHTAAEFRVSNEIKRRRGANLTKDEVIFELNNIATKHEEQKNQMEKNAAVAMMIPMIAPPRPASFRIIESSDLQNHRFLSAIRPGNVMETISIFGDGATRRTEHIVKEPKQEIEQKEEEDPSSGPSKQLAIAPPPPGKKSYNKMSKLCQGLINSLRFRGVVQFRASDRTNFCLACLSFKKCPENHAAPWKELDTMWRNEFGHEHVTPDELIEQLEVMKQRFLAEEGAEGSSSSQNSN